MAWSVLSPALKVHIYTLDSVILSYAYLKPQMIEKQKKRDEMIFELLDAMNNAYDFVDHTKPLRIDDLGDTRKEIIKKLLQQTYDCAWFIRDYTSRGFCESIFFRNVNCLIDDLSVGRTLDGMTSGHDSIVKKYIKAFSKLQECFESENLVGIEVSVHRTLTVAQNIRE
jgi:hypothetical protein